MELVPIKVFAGLELMSACVFGVGAVILGVIGLLTLAVYFQKRGEENSKPKDKTADGSDMPERDVS